MDKSPTRPRRPRAPAGLPLDPSDEELAQDWTLSEADKIEIRQCRGDDNRLRFAIQLCVLRLHGCFLNAYETMPLRIANHLGRQLGLSPMLLLGPTSRPATESEYRQRLRHYLGYRSFDADIQAALERRLESKARSAVASQPLLGYARDVLRSWQVIPPAGSTLERLVASVITRARDDTFERIAAQLAPELRQTIDELLVVPEDEARSPLFYLKAYPPEATPPAMLSYLERERFLRTLGAGEIDLAGVSPELLAHLAQVVRHYEVRELKRFAPHKRYALVACFLGEAQKTILDHLIEMHSQYVTGMSRRSRRALEKRRRALRPRAKKGLDTVLQAMEILLDPERSRDTLLDELYRDIEEPKLHQALDHCRAFQRLEERGAVDELCARHSHLKRYLPTFLELPFQAEPGMQPLLAAVVLACRLGRGEIKTLPIDAPVDFVPAAWRNVLSAEPGRLDRRVWEIALAFAVRDALRAGDLYLADSRHHVSFWNLIYDESRWIEQRQQAYVELSLPNEADRALGRLRSELDQATTGMVQSLPHNPFATIEAGELKLKRRDALEVTDRVRALRRVIDTHLPKVRIEDLLWEVDEQCHFTQALRPLGGYPPRMERFSPTLLASLVAHGTNLGIAMMGESTDDITVDRLQHVSQTCLRTETLKAANTVLVDYHHRLALSAIWGDGTISSSDGQRFGIEARSLLGSFYPRYFGYYDRALTVYTHTSDQHSVFGTQAIACGPREALYVLDGLLENDTILRPREHFVDTAGSTEQLFGLCYLLRISFMPRLADLKDQRLYKMDRNAVYGDLDALLSNTANVNLIREQWDQLVRVAASLRQRTAPAHVVLQRLANSSDRLAKALTALGQIVKTIHILRYLHDADLRDRIQLQLNRGEFRHKLASRLFFANQGIFRIGDYEEIMNKVSCLSLLSNAVLVWNTLRIADIETRLRAAGESIDRDDLARVSPLAHGHVIPNGTYRFKRAK